MGRIVFNNKLCDDEPTCPAVKKCEEKLGSKAALRFNSTTAKIEIRDKTLCIECRECTRVCKLFVVADSDAEEWYEREKVKNTKIDPKFQLIDRYGASYITEDHRLEVADILERDKLLNGLTILEIVYKQACLSEFDSVPIKDILPENVYETKYFKICLKTEEEVALIEDFFGIEEIPCMLFLVNGEVEAIISGIYQNLDERQAQQLKDSCKKLLGGLKL